MAYPYYDEAGQELISAPQDFTASWVDLGPEIKAAGYGLCAFWLNLDINDGADLRFRVVAKHEFSGADEFLLPIKTVGTSSASVEDLYYEFADDADQLVVLAVLLDGAVPYVQAQISAGTPGATAAQVDAALYTRAGFSRQ